MLEVSTHRTERDRSRMPFSDVSVKEEVGFGRREWVLMWEMLLYVWSAAVQMVSNSRELQRASSVLPSAWKLGPPRFNFITSGCQANLTGYLAALLEYHGKLGYPRKVVDICYSAVRARWEAEAIKILEAGGTGIEQDLLPNRRG